MFSKCFKPLALNIEVLPNFRASITNLRGETIVIPLVRLKDSFRGTVPEDALGAWSCFGGKTCEFILTNDGSITELEYFAWDDPWL